MPSQTAWNLTEYLQLINIVATCLAVIAAPIISLWAGNRIQDRTERKKAKLNLIATLLSLRHDTLSYEAIKALNLIDAVYADEPSVREAWTRYYAVLNDPNIFSAGTVGTALAEEKRRDLICAMTATTSWTKNLTSADIMRAYGPKGFTDSSNLTFWENRFKMHDINDKASKHGYDFKPFPDLKDYTPNHDLKKQNPDDSK